MQMCGSVYMYVSEKSKNKAGLTLTRGRMIVPEILSARKALLRGASRYTCPRQSSCNPQTSQCHLSPHISRSVTYTMVYKLLEITKVGHVIGINVYYSSPLPQLLAYRLTIICYHGKVQRSTTVLIQDLESCKVTECHPPLN